MLDNKAIFGILSLFAQYLSVLIMSGIMMLISSDRLDHGYNALARIGFISSNILAGLSAIISTFSISLYSSNVYRMVIYNQTINTLLYDALSVLTVLWVWSSFITYYLTVLLSMSDTLDIFVSVTSVTFVSLLSYAIINYLLPDCLFPGL